MKRGFLNLSLTSLLLIIGIIITMILVFTAIQQKAGGALGLG